MMIVAPTPRCETCGEPAEVLHVCIFCGSLKCEGCLTFAEIVADKCSECLADCRADAGAEMAEAR